jgi:hypothetical protein
MIERNLKIVFKTVQNLKRFNFSSKRVFLQLGPKMVPFILGPQSKRAQIVSPKTGPGLPQNGVRRQAQKMIPFFGGGGSG